MTRRWNHLANVCMFGLFAVDDFTLGRPIWGAVFAVCAAAYAIAALWPVDEEY